MRLGHTRVKPVGKSIVSSTAAWILIASGVLVLPYSVNAEAPAELVEDVSSVCAAEGTQETLVSWTHNSEALKNPATGFDTKWATPAAYTTTGVTSTIPGSTTATDLTYVPATKDSASYLAYPFTTGSSTRVIIDSFTYGDSVATPINMQAVLYKITEGVATAVTGAQSVDVVTTNAAEPSYISEAFAFPKTLLASNQSYEMRVLVWYSNPTFEGFDDFAINFKPCLAGAPVIGSVTTTSTTASVPFTPPSITGGSDITNYQYSIDNGSTWVTRDPAATTSPLEISGLAAGSTVNIKLRAVTTAGNGVESDVSSQTLSEAEPEASPEPEPEPYVPAPPCEAAPSARSVASGGSLFLGGYFIELGISPLGNFGTNTSKPAGIYGTSGSSRVGMSVDYDGFGCGANKAIDFFLPGSPEERFAVGAKAESSSPAQTIGISQLGGVSNTEGLQSVTASDTTITNLSSGTLLRAKVVSLLKTADGSNWLEVTQDISFEVDAMYFTNQVTLKNLTSGNLDSARFMRSFDPDNTVFQGGSYETENTVLAQYQSDSYSTVRAQVTTGNLARDPIYQTYGTRAPIIFYSNDENSRAGAFGFSNSNPYATSAYDSAPSKGFTVDDDAAITMTLEYGPLTANQQKTKTYVTSLDLRDFSELAAELEVGAISAGSGFSVSPRSQTISGSPGEAKSSAELRTSGFTGTVSYEIISGIIPDGMTLNSATGVVSGTPISPRSGSVTIKATGSETGEASAVINFSIKTTQSPISLTSTQGTVGTGLTLTSSGGSGTGAVSYSVSNGTASGCAVAAGVLTASSSGTCIVTVTKAADAEYLSVSSSATTVTFIAKPGAPTITAVTPGVLSLSVAFTAPESDGGSAITNYGYSIDGGATVIPFSPAQTTSPLTISGLTGGLEYSVKIVAINAAGQSDPSPALTGTPSFPPSPAPTPSPTPTPSVTPTPQPSASPSLIPTIQPSPPPVLQPTPSPSPTGSIALMVELEEIPGVIYGSTNPIPQVILDILLKPLAYILSELSGSPILPELAPSESLAYENGQPVAIELVKTESENGYVLRGDGWEVALEATDSSGEPMRLDDSGNIILNQDRFVEFSGTGFAPGSIIKVWLFSDPAELSDVIADASGNFTGRSLIPEGVPTGEHTIQLNGLTQDGQLRSVSLGVVIQPELVAAAPVFTDMSGLMNLLLLLAAAVLLFFFILWRRRRKEDEEVVQNDLGELSPIFANEEFQPLQQFPQDSRRNIGPGSPPNRKRFKFRPKQA